MTTFNNYPFLKTVGLAETNEGAFYDGKWQTTNSTATLKSVNPSNGELIATTKCASLEDYEKAVKAMKVAHKEWASVPMPKRGEIVRQIGDAMRKHKVALGNTVSLEMGKIESEGYGEVQESIDICDMACGMSRTIGYIFSNIEDRSSTRNDLTTS